ncbi:SsgA family sporulation/cell division regulator [Streptomyces monticola]|uniref:SsgA family sporulation/cell division regulator n=1 Tax=Streptomyces monticola TaxID=2666263 RepID=A0ABW2JKS2_9ACTN
MSAVVEEHARAHLVTDAPDGQRALRVALRYDPSSEAHDVRIALPGSPPEKNVSGKEWALPRELLEQGLRSPAGSGDIRVWPCGRVQVVVEFHAPGGVTVLQFDCVPLMRFLRRTYAAAAPVTP